jgi:hypothetical protein
VRTITSLDGNIWREKFSQVRKFDKENIRRVGKFREWKY